KIAQIATGEIDDEAPDDGKDPAAKALGAKGGKARAAKLSPERKKEIAQKAAAKRWGETKP
ncbi:MAG: RNA-binding protein, partial [Pseudomonadota bacterium]